MTQAGPKHTLAFTPVRLGDLSISDPRLKELIQWGRTFYEMGLAPSYGTGSHGNLSIRAAQGIVITATKTFLGQLESSHFVQIVDGDLLTSPPHVSYYGRGEPSTDSLIHWTLYHLRPDISCILHAHDTVVLEYAHQLGLPQTEQTADAGSPHLVDMIRPLVTCPYFLIRGHGFVAMGRTVEEAGEQAIATHRRAMSLTKQMEG